MYDACAALHLHLPHDNQAISSLNSTLLSVFNRTKTDSRSDSVWRGEETWRDRTLNGVPSLVFIRALAVNGGAREAGTGVRVAFYSQAVLNAVLVAYSPQDSPSAAWAATLLVSAVVIPAWVQKKQGRLQPLSCDTRAELRHIVFAGIAGRGSTLPIWRKRGMQIPLEQRRDSLRRPRHRASPSLGAESDMSDDESTAMLGQVNQERHPPGSKKNVTYQRVVLSLALMAQVALQWSYAALLYTSPYYAEVSCNKHTRVALFGWPLPANELAEHLFPVWALWLVFNGGVTLASGVFLVISGGRDTPAPKKNTESLKHTKLSALRNLIQNGPLRRRAFMVVALILAVGFLANSEIQHGANCL
ncbi:hypothetical protein BKA62DRAFT_774112 [Auriculariales sp. MPI-PUGE-AT-0066]|nr:hypothetical protein BKA62DRAFT_774112 [Auriculariales sp. MPI-PUGE-AT-0066]